MQQDNINNNHNQNTNFQQHIPNNDQQQGNEELENDFGMLDEDASFIRAKRIKDSTNLQEQKKKILSDSTYTQAVRNVKNGQFWEYPKDHIVRTSHCLKDCWKDFYQLRVFHWMPSIILGGSWKPTCLNCGEKCIGSGRNNPPRLVFDQFNNYWLNAPEKYKCHSCIDNESDEKCYFLSTDPLILKQIANQNPELFDMFPCHLSNINAIDKKLMEMIQHCAVKGIGPWAMAENIASWHELEAQKKENEWGAYVNCRLYNPTIGQAERAGAEIEKCPNYYSTALGGCVPSGQWLMSMFCITIESQRARFDSECIK